MTTKEAYNEAFPHVNPIEDDAPTIRCWDCMRPMTHYELRNMDAEANPIRVPVCEEHRGVEIE